VLSFLKKAILMNYKKNIKKIINNTIWITGCARSGTTILGKILSTLKNVEYAFEPSYLHTLLARIHILSKKNWLPLYNEYLIEYIFFNSCLGRNANLRKIDDSYIGNSLSSKDLKAKLKVNLSRIKFENYLKKNKKSLIIKIPGVSRSLVALEKYYPKNKFIISKRNSKSISKSIVKKKWFRNNKNLPVAFNNQNLFGKKIHKKWIKLNEKKKTEEYIKYVEKECKKLKNKHIFSYDNFIQNPEKEINKICKFLNLKKTSKTLEILKTVRQT